MAWNCFEWLQLAGNYRKLIEWLERARNWWTLLEIAGMAGKWWKWLEIAGTDKNSWTWLEIAWVVVNDWKWLNMAGMDIHCLKWLELAVYGSLPYHNMQRHIRTTGPFKQENQKSWPKSCTRTISVHFREMVHAFNQFFWN